MDFDIVKRQIINQYLHLYGSANQGDEWSLENCIDLFRKFYIQYWYTFGVAHPRLSKGTIQKIILAIPSMSVENPYRENESDLTMEDYEALIPAYFKKKFKNCNYSIAHFMSGQIRELCFFEALY